jgi:hypothetical protein
MTNAKQHARTSLTTRLLIATLALISLPACATSATTTPDWLGTTTSYGFTARGQFEQITTFSSDRPPFPTSTARRSSTTKPDLRPASCHQD